MQLNRRQSAAPLATPSPSVNTIGSNLVERGSSASEADTIARVKAAVLARLNGQVDPVLLEAVIQRVVSALK
jgi:hypothetical protein